MPMPRRSLYIKVALVACNWNGRRLNSSSRVASSLVVCVLQTAERNMQKVDRTYPSYVAGHLGARATQLRTVISLEFLGGRDCQY